MHPDVKMMHCTAKHDQGVCCCFTVLTKMCMHKNTNLRLARLEHTSVWDVLLPPTPNPSYTPTYNTTKIPIHVVSTHTCYVLGAY